MSECEKEIMDTLKSFFDAEILNTISYINNMIIVNLKNGTKSKITVKTINT